MVFLLPLLGAGWIAITRCEDYRHDVYDVGVGSLIGITTAYWSYRRHWPGLGERGCHEPYPHPSAGKDGWAILRRTEEGDLEGGDGDFELDNMGTRR
jgi:diacylglycerol diphosphate phosphatase/phosphatidate phosphatase